MERENLIGRGLLKKSSANPRYFEDGAGKPILLTGSHTWANFQEVRLAGEPDFDYDEFLDMMVSRNHNFMRLWQWGHPVWAPWTKEKVHFSPLPYARSGAESASDGLPKFDLEHWNDEYFARLRDRVEKAGKRGIYVSVMFFDGWCPKNAIPEADPWSAHPYNRPNNVNGVHAESGEDGKPRLYSLDSPTVVERQKAFIRKCIDTLNDFDHVLFEIINEVEAADHALKWHYHMVDYVRQYEAAKPKQHPVGMTATGGGDQFNPLLFESSADWIAPGGGPQYEYMTNPPAASGDKVIILDSDHIYGHGGTYVWVWKAFTRGMNPIFMDPWAPIPGEPIHGYINDTNHNVRDYPDWEPARRSMGQIREFSERIDLGRMLPDKDLTSTGYALADPGQAYLVLITPNYRQAEVDLRKAPGLLSVEWFDPLSGRTETADAVPGGRITRFDNPFPEAAVLYLYAVKE